MTTYSQRSTNTRARRREAGMYRSPTSDQREALRKYMSGCGVQAMSAWECVLLSDYPSLTHSQQSEWMGRALAKGWK
jgi:hypothetical protein